MYRRFLNTNDYLGLVTKEALGQLTRGNDERFSMAEEAAEVSILEYLTENYEIEKTLEEGKKIQEYNPQITYSVGEHFYLNDKLYEAIRVIGGRVRPNSSPYWVEVCNDDPFINDYNQFQDYQPGECAKFSNAVFQCVLPNGPSFNDIRVPNQTGWEEAEVEEWMANYPYPLWQVCLFEGKFYTLMDITTDMDWTKNPYESEAWGLIADYDPSYNEYEFSDHEYVVYDGKVFFPAVPANSPEIRESYNVTPHDPRNSNVKKHMLRLAIYELHKLISPNNISQSRITDYETSILWLRDASRLKINPQIPRKIDEEMKPAADYAIATFARDYDPNKNPWQV